VTKEETGLRNNRPLMAINLCDTGDMVTGCLGEIISLSLCHLVGLC
jgi:hypothetical protein